jgi:hypothetical protein
MMTITLSSLSGHDDVLREDFLRVIGVFGKGRSADLKLRPCVIESGNKNLYFLREEHPAGKISFDKVVTHRSSTEWAAQAAAGENQITRIEGLLSYTRLNSSNFFVNPPSGPVGQCLPADVAIR